MLISFEIQFVLLLDYIKLILVSSFCLSFVIQSEAQILDASRSVDWSIAGLKDTSTLHFELIDMSAKGVVGDGITANDSIVSSVLDSLSDQAAILLFPAGNFLYNETLRLRDNLVVKGGGADETIFSFDLDGNGHSILVQGNYDLSDTAFVVMPAKKDSNLLLINDTTNLVSGDWVQLFQDDIDLVTSSWAEKSIGQIIQIDTVINDSIILSSSLRMDYDTLRNPYLIKMEVVQNVGIECLKILRLDDTAPIQTSNINFHKAVNCWVRGIESDHCTFSHVQARQSSNLNISNSYFHHAFDYGGGGRAYGVMLHSTSNEILVEHNVFEHLRHSMIVQSGANGNVFAYNYSFDAFWDSPPSDAAGDMVLHGNYPYANLFEQNICRNIVIDNSHGPNGPHNTFFRNRSEGYGIFFSAANSPSQNIIANEIPNMNLPYSFVNYTIQGIDHFIYGNNDKGSIHPQGTEELFDSSYAYLKRPINIPINQWAGIGTPNMMGENSILALDQFDDGSLLVKPCEIIVSATTEKVSSNVLLKIFPNPAELGCLIESDIAIKQLRIFNTLGIQYGTIKNLGSTKHLSLENWESGIYFFLFEFADGSTHVELLVKK